MWRKHFGLRLALDVSDPEISALVPTPRGVIVLGATEQGELLRIISGDGTVPVRWPMEGVQHVRLGVHDIETASLWLVTAQSELLRVGLDDGSLERWSLPLDQVAAIAGPLASGGVVVGGDDRLVSVQRGVSTPLGDGCAPLGAGEAPTSCTLAVQRDRVWLTNPNSVMSLAVNGEDTAARKASAVDGPAASPARAAS